MNYLLKFPDNIIMFDRGYPSEDMFRFLNSRGILFLMRVPKTLKKPLLNSWMFCLHIFFHMIKRRNWLFCDSTDGADTSMVVYSLLETARSNGLNPQKYPKYLLEAGPNENMSNEELEDMGLWSSKVQELCVNKS